VCVCGGVWVCVCVCVCVQANPDPANYWWVIEIDGPRGPNFDGTCAPPAPTPLPYSLTTLPAGPVSPPWESPVFPYLMVGVLCVILCLW
jgi:hypothetical protein